MGGWNKTLTYTYDKNSNRTQLTHDDGNSFAYDYDGLNRIAGISENSVSVIEHLYRNNGQMGLRQSTGWTIGVTGWRHVYGYDPAQRLTAMRQRFDGAASITAYANTARFYYNPAGQMKSRTISNDAYAETSLGLG